MAGGGWAGGARVLAPVEVILVRWDGGVLAA
jgi:hypothetical protein